MVKVIIPTFEPGGLGVKIYPHWKDSPTFTIINIENTDYTCEYIVRVSSDELIVNMIKSYKVDAVLTLSLSTRALELLEKIGVKVYVGKNTDVNKMIEDFIENKLHRITICRYIGGIRDFKK